MSSKPFTITVLNNNLGNGDCQGEHGLCLLVEADFRLLFDTGPSDVAWRNANALGITLDDISTVVLSHGHWDHSGGLQWLNKKTLVCHPDALKPKYRKRDRTYNGVPKPDEVTRKFILKTSFVPTWLSKTTLFLGEIPRLNKFESQTTDFCHQNGSDDFMRDDSGLVINHPEGLIVISGCAHSGICNMVDYAIRVTGKSNVLAVIGGFHLKGNDMLTEQTINRLKELHVKSVLPFHCTETPAIRDFGRVWPVREVVSGDRFVF